MMIATCTDLHISGFKLHIFVVVATLTIEQVVKSILSNGTGTGTGTGMNGF